MASTLATLRNRLRVGGRDIAISGTADSGSDIDTVKDADVLVQAENYWAGYWCHIESAGEAAPEGESRKVISSDQSETTITVEPFTAAVAASDTFTLAVFSNAELLNFLNEAVLDLSQYKPEYTSATLSIVANTKRYTPPTGMIRADRIVYINASTQEEREYGFTYEKHADKIALDSYATESKSATIYYTKKHTLYSADDDTSTVEVEDERLLLLYARAQMALARLSDTSKLIKYTIGNISEDFGAAAKALQSEYDELTKAYQAGVAQLYVGFSEEAPAQTGAYQDWPLPVPFNWITEL